MSERTPFLQKFAEFNKITQQHITLNIEILKPLFQLKIGRKFRLSKKNLTIDIAQWGYEQYCLVIALNHRLVIVIHKYQSLNLIILSTFIHNYISCMYTVVLYWTMGNSLPRNSNCSDKRLYTEYLNVSHSFNNHLSNSIIIIVINNSQPVHIHVHAYPNTSIASVFHPYLIQSPTIGHWLLRVGDLS